MIRGFQLADFFTLGNAGCGVAAVLFAMLYAESGAVAHIYSSAGMMAAAFVFDVLDGRIARWRH
jgi:CDP-diacylglycerol--serine O-phosphatidyltransferase